jgi:hypothetical protein
MQFEKRHVLLLVGVILVALVTGSQVNVAIRHPDYAGLDAIVYLLRFLPSQLITNTARYGLPFLTSFFLVQRKYMYAGIVSLLLGLNWVPPLMNNAASSPPLSWIGVRGVGLMWLSYLGIGLITLMIHVQRLQLPTVVHYFFIGILLATALIVSITEILYWTTTSFGYL